MARPSAAAIMCSMSQTSPTQTRLTMQYPNVATTMRARQGARTVMAATTRAQIAPEEKPTSSARLVSTAQVQPVPRKSASSAAVPIVLTS
jgi:hypothetical protein